MTLVGAVVVGDSSFAFAPASDRAFAHTTRRYRPDIDGLRGIAVLAVVLLHSGIACFGGGFVGVDVFFVISGYLIHRELAGSLAERRFSAIDFYGRRLRRTLPALYLVSAVTLIVATIVMVPGDLDDAARSLLSAIAFVPNLYFWQGYGYFDPEALTKPLLHTWSLGVEAQFYLVAPLLALGLYQLPQRARRGALVALFVLALATALALHQASWATGFYLAPARLFEFLIGAALAEGIVPPITRSRTAEIVSGIALLTIGLTIVLYDSDTSHPGLPTLVPCLAAAALIHAGERRETFVGRLLRLPALAFLGLISYSVYLWHWPILVLTRAAGVTETPFIVVTQVVLVLGLSILSWRYVEVPFRSAGSICRARLPWLAPAGAASLAALALVLVGLSGLPQRFPPEVAAVGAYYNQHYDKPFRRGQCFITSADRLSDFDRAVCLRLDATKPNVLLLGDSHAAQLYMALRDAWPNANVLQATASGCKPMSGTSGPTRCTALMEDMLQRFIPSHRLDAVVIAGLWDEQDIAPLKRTLTTLRPDVGKIVLFGPVPKWDMPLATLLARDMMRHSFDNAQEHLVGEVPSLDRRIMDETAAVATYVSPWETLCGSGACRLFTALGAPVQFDSNHLTPAGATELVADIRLRQPMLLGSPYRSTSSR